jgi:hypothetical protein
MGGMIAACRWSERGLSARANGRHAKESYATAFFDAPAEAGQYDVRKLMLVLDALLAESVRLAEVVKLSTA